MLRRTARGLIVPVPPAAASRAVRGNLVTDMSLSPDEFDRFELSAPPLSPDADGEDASGGVEEVVTDITFSLKAARVRARLPVAATDGTGYGDGCRRLRR